MKYPHIAARLFNTPLLIHPQKLDAIIAGLGPRVFGVAPDALQLQVAGAEALLSPELFSTKKGARNDERGYKVVDGVAVVAINGATVHRSRLEADSTFLLGYNDITADVEHAMDNPDVHAVLRVYDSPGGEVQGAFEHADRMRALLGKKPMIAIADGMAASAGYLGGSAADELVITSTGYAGSIGVVMRHIDFSRALQNDGIQVTHIFAGAHKVDGHPYAPLPDAVRADFQAEIDELYAMFVETVVAQRGMTAEGVRATEAAVFRGAAAVQAGLADRLSTTDQLISELAAKRSTRSYGLPARSTANKGAKTMSGNQEQAGNDTPAAFAQADLDRARAEGIAAGTTAERERISTILQSEAATGRHDMASHLAFGTDMAADAAIALLGKAPALATAKPGASALAAAMAAVEQPNVGADTGAAASGSETGADSQAKGILADFNRATGRK